MRRFLVLLTSTGIITLCLFLFAHLALSAEMSLDDGLDQITKQVSESVPGGKKSAIAVMDFNDLQGNVMLLGKYICEELITKLFQTKQFKVIERSLLDKAIQELKFNTSDLVDTSNAKQLGKVVGADSIVVGTLTDLGSSVKINARIILVESGEVVGAANAQIVKDTSIEKMMGQKSSRSSGRIQESSHNQQYDIVIESTTDNSEEVYLDGELLFNNGNWETRSVSRKAIAPGKHVLAYHAKNSGYEKGILSSVRDVKNGDVISHSQPDDSWKYNTFGPILNWNQSDFDDSSWQALIFVANYGASPWRKISGWTDESANWIWGGSGDEIWVRHEFTIP